MCRTTGGSSLDRSGRGRETRWGSTGSGLGVDSQNVSRRTAHFGTIHSQRRVCPWEHGACHTQASTDRIPGSAHPVPEDPDSGRTLGVGMEGPSWGVINV